MTRAKRSLCLISGTDDGLAEALPGTALRRSVVVEPPPEIDLERTFVQPDMRFGDLSWCGRLRPDHLGAKAIAEAKVGDTITLREEGSRWILHDICGRPLGRMARSWTWPDQMRLSTARIGAIVRRRRIDNDEAYQANLRRDEWEVVLPELIFVPSVPTFKASQRH